MTAWSDPFTQHLAAALPDRRVTEAEGHVHIAPASRRDTILSVAKRLLNQPLMPMQPLADELVPLGIDVSANPEHMRALAVLTDNLRYGMPPSLRALECLGCAA
jgi:hypothetical protein